MRVGVVKPVEWLLYLTLFLISKFTCQCVLVACLDTLRCGGAEGT